MRVMRTKYSETDHGFYFVLCDAVLVFGFVEYDRT